MREIILFRIQSIENAVDFGNGERFSALLFQRFGFQFGKGVVLRMNDAEDQFQSLQMLVIGTGRDSGVP